QAGMIAGFAAIDDPGRPRTVIGIDASARITETRAQVGKIARNTAELIGLGRDLRDDEITVLAGWAGDHYGIPVRSTLDAIRLTGRLEGMIIDPVYEGKSMAGLIDLVRTGQIGPDSTVLYAHLGGQPALNAYSALFPAASGWRAARPATSRVASMAVVFALLAALSNAASVATQHIASTAGPRRSSGWRVVLYLFHNPLWLFGWVALAG